MEDSQAEQPATAASQTELAIKNEKVQAGGKGWDFSEFLSPKLAHPGARTALQDENILISH